MVFRGRIDQWMKENRSVNKEEVKGLVCRTNSHRWSPKGSIRERRLMRRLREASFFLSFKGRNARLSLVLPEEEGGRTIPSGLEAPCSLRRLPTSAG